MVTTATLSWKIDGAALTEMVRSIYADEGRPDRALAILEAGFPEMGKARCLAILTGSKKLVGNETGMDLEDDDATETKNGCALDLSRTINNLRDDVAEYRDVVAIQNGDTVAYGSPTGIIRIPHHRAEDYRKGNVTLDDMMYVKSSESPDFQRLAQRQGCGVSRGEIYGKGCVPAHPTMQADKECFRREPLTLVKEDHAEEPKLDVVVMDHIPHGRAIGWLAPDGRFYLCAEREHIALAETLGYEEKQVEALGWIKLTPSFPNDSFPSKRPVTQAQLDRLFDYLGHLPDWAKEDY